MELTQEYVRECFDYDPDTGELIWKVRPREHFKNAQAMRRFNTQFAGNVAGSSRTDKNGYTRTKIGLSGLDYLAHRLVWLLNYGRLPAVLDHIDGNATNNRLENLRGATPGLNMRNMRRMKNNTTGHCGVYVSRSGKWCAHIRLNGRTHHLGTFDAIEEAVAARQAANRRHGFTARHGTAC